MVATMTTGPEIRIISGRNSTPNRKKNRVSAVVAPNPWLAQVTAKSAATHPTNLSSPYLTPIRRTARARSCVWWVDREDLRLRYVDGQGHSFP